jgi:hypothetical protein
MDIRINVPKTTGLATPYWLLETRRVLRSRSVISARVIETPEFWVLRGLASLRRLGLPLPRQALRLGDLGGGHFRSNGVTVLNDRAALRGRAREIYDLRNILAQ